MNKFFKFLPAVLAGVFGVTAIISAWVEPAVAPPGGNVPSPINTGNIQQSRGEGNVTFGKSTDSFGLKSSKVVVGVPSDSTSTDSMITVVGGQSWGTDLSLDATNFTPTDKAGRRWLLASTGGGATEGVGKFLIKDATAGIVRMIVDSEGVSALDAGQSLSLANYRTNPNGRMILMKNDTSHAGYDMIFNNWGTSANAGGWLFANTNANYGVVKITSDGKMGIGTTAPAQKLDVAGTAQVAGFKMTTGAGADKILTSDANGLASWKSLSGGLVRGVYLAPEVSETRRVGTETYVGGNVCCDAGDFITGLLANMSSNGGIWPQGGINDAGNCALNVQAGEKASGNTNKQKVSGICLDVAPKH